MRKSLCRIAPDAMTNTSHCVAAGSVDSMADSDRIIVVIDAANDRARSLKGLIDFMDGPAVCVADPDDWQSRIGQSSLMAIFIRDDLARKDRDRIIGAVGELDQNVPIVLIGGEADG